MNEITKEINLPALAKQINENHREILRDAKNMVVKAIAAGEALIAVKAALSVGEWLPWIRDNLTISDRTAQRWMQAAAYKRQLETEANYRSATLADQSVNEMMRMLQARKPSKKKPKLEEPPTGLVLGGVDAPKREEPSLDDYITNTAADELFPILREHYDAEQLIKLAGLINGHLGATA
jgi:hypothetical protein